MNIKWDNLKEKKCPRCGSEMATEGSKLICKATHDPRCHFSVHCERAGNIIRHGNDYHQKPPMKRVRLKWQLLHESRCPACATELRDKEGKGRLTCETPECTFIINEYRLQECLEDSEHACNTYYGRDYQNDIQVNLGILGVEISGA